MPHRVLAPAALAVAAALGLLATWFATYRVELTSWADRGVQTGPSVSTTLRPPVSPSTSRTSSTRARSRSWLGR